MRLLHKFLRWFPAWALGAIVSCITLAIAAAQVWNAAKIFDENVVSVAWTVLKAPISWTVALALALLWLLLVWWTRPRRSQRAISSDPENLPMADEFVALLDAGTWFYTHANEPIREILRGGSTVFPSIAEHGAAFFRDAAKRRLCDLYGRLEPGLPMERIEAGDVILSPFEQAFGTERKLAIDESVKRSDLARVLAFYEKDEPIPSPLEIHFDPTNPARRFWSMESPKDPSGTSLPGVFWEYRVEVRNASKHTLRNVSITTEHLGLLPVRPVNQPFDKGRHTTCNIQPGCSELAVVVRWPIPTIQAGMLAGPSAKEYGPIKVTVSADDVSPAVKTFGFDYQREPMISEEASETGV